MSSGITKTPYVGFNLVSFDFPRWGTYEHENWRLIDSILQASGVINAGIWRNDTVYAAGTRVVDNTTSKIYAALVAHTSSATATFAEERAAHPTYWAEVINAPIYRGVWAPFTNYNYLDVVNLASGATYICINAHTSSSTFNPAFWTQTAPGFPATMPSTWATVSGKPEMAQCRLEYSGGNLVLLPEGGDRITIGGIERVIPAAGVPLSAAGLIAPQISTNRVISANLATLTFAANTIPVGARIGVKGLAGTNQAGYQGSYVVTGSTGTTIQYNSSVTSDASTADVTGTVYVVYYIYAGTDGGGNITVEASLTGHTLDPTLKVRTKTGDASRRLVGMATVGPGPAWVDSATQKFVRSYHNRRRRASKAVGTADRTYTATTQGEIHSEYRTEFLAWSDEVVDVGMTGDASATTNSCWVYISVDAVSVAEDLFTIGGSTGAIGLSANVEGLAEGYHVATPQGKAGAGGTLTVYASAANSIAQSTACVG